MTGVRVQGLGFRFDLKVVGAGEGFRMSICRIRAKAVWGQRAYYVNLQRCSFWYLKCKARLAF